MEAVVNERSVCLKLLQRGTLDQDLVGFGYSELDIL